MPERGKQLVVVALMETDGRLVENVEHAHQAAADLRGKTDALRLAAGERRARAGKRQIFKPHRAQKAQSRLDLLQNALTDKPLLRCQRGLQLLHEVKRRNHGFFRIVRNAAAADRDGKRLAAQALPPAVRTRALAHAGFQLVAHAVALRFAVAPLQIGDHALKRLIQNALSARLIVLQLQLFALCAVQNNVHHGRRERFDRIAQRKMIFFRKRLKIHTRDPVSADVGPARRADRAVEDGERRVGDHQRGIDLEL